MVTRAIGVTSVWDLVPDDAELYSSVFQEHFANTNLQVIAIFKALKISSQAEAAAGKNGAAAAETRILGHKKYGVSFDTGSLQYSARGAPMSISLLKAIHMLDPPAQSGVANVLGTVWAAKPKTKGGLPVMPAGFVQPTKNSTPFHYAFPTAARRITCACCLFCVARTFAGRKPVLHGMTADFVDGWVRRNAAERPDSIVPSALERLAFAHGGAGGTGGIGAEWAQLSAKDAAHLSGLLEIVQSTGELEVESIRERLQAEYTALEAANVHAILDAAASVPRVVHKIDAAFVKLDDLDLSLDVFDGKMAAMRDDIATIESRNNSLETQTRSLERLQRALQELLAALTPSHTVRMLETLQPGERTVYAAVLGLTEARKQLSSLRIETPGKQGGLQREVAGMQAVSEFREWLEETVEEFLARCRGALGGALSSGDVLSRDAQPRLKDPPPGLAYAPLFHALPAVEGGPAILADARAQCLSALGRAIQSAVRGAANSAERAVTAAVEDTKGGNANAVYGPAVNALRDTVPPAVHCLVYAADLLCLREKASQEVVGGGNKGLAAQWLAEASASRRSSRDTTPPAPVPLRKLMTPTAALSETGVEALGQCAAGMREPLRRVVKAMAAKSAIPLIPYIAAAVSWRRVLAQYAAAAPIATELDAAAQEAGTELDSRQAALIAAADKADAARGGGTFGGGDSSVKDIGVLPRVRQLAADMGEVMSFLRAGLPALQWWWPWGEESEAASSASVTRRALEPTGRAFSTPYAAAIAAVGKLRDRDAKHGPRFALENLSYLQPAAEGLASVAPDMAVHSKDVAAQLKSAQDAYVEQQLQASPVWPLLTLAAKLRVLLKDVRPADARFQQGYAQATVASGIDGGYKGLDKKFREIGQRTKKHLASNPALLSVAWSAIEGSITLQLEQFEKDVAAAYPDVSVPVPASQVAKLLQSAAPT